MEKPSDTPYGTNITKRFVSPGGEELLFRPEILVEHPWVAYGDDFNQRFHEQVVLVGYMGGDPTVELAATGGRGQSLFSEELEPGELLEHLVASGIRRPFKNIHLRFSIHAPIEVAENDGVYCEEFSVNELSGRYSLLPETAHIPTIETIAAQLPDDVPSDNAAMILEHLQKVREASYLHYERLVNLPDGPMSRDKGPTSLARELARVGLGSDQHTGWFLKVNLESLARFVDRQRKCLDDHDISRDYVEALAEMAGKVAPYAWQALMNPNPRKLRLTWPKDEEIIDPSLSGVPWEPSETKRPVVPALEEILFHSQKLLDQGEFQIVDYSGDDLTAVHAARVSYQGGTRQSRKARALIRYLIANRHTTPFEMPSISVRSKHPEFVHRQLARHRTGPQTKVGGRVRLGSKPYIPKEDQMQYQSPDNKQGRKGKLIPEHMEVAYDHLNTTFDTQVEAVPMLRGLNAPEEAIRRMKGVGHYTITTLTTDTHNAFHLLGLRNHSHAQWEIREWAQLFSDAVERHVPISYEAQQNFVWDAMRFAADEQDILAGLIDLSDIDPSSPETYHGAKGFLKKGKEGPELSRRGKTLEGKLLVLRDCKESKDE